MLGLESLVNKVGQFEQMLDIESIKSIFERHGSHLIFDLKIAEKINKYCKSFINKNDDHIQFFGSNLTGVYPVRMTAVDEMEWLVDILGLDSIEIKQEVKALPTINENWIRGTDVFTLSCWWVTYRLLNSNIPIKQKEIALRSAILTVHFKMISSIMAHYFRYSVDKAVAQAVYDRLSLKFRLKTEGSWLGLLQYRTEDLLLEKSIHYQTLLTYSPDDAIQYLITDTQGRLRDVVKNLWTVLAEVRQEEKRGVNKSMIDLDGDLAVRDVQSQLRPYTDYVLTVSKEPASFLKTEIVKIVCDVNPNMPPEEFRKALQMVVALRVKGDKKIEAIIELTMTHVFDQFAKDRKLQKSIKNLPVLVAYMRALYTAPRSKGDVLTLRSDLEKLITKYVKTKTPANTSSVRTGVLLYIIIRAFSKDYFS